jgi:hypothetical protein
MTTCKKEARLGITSQLDWCVFFNISLRNWKKRFGCTIDYPTWKRTGSLNSFSILIRIHLSSKPFFDELWKLRSSNIFHLQGVVIFVFPTIRHCNFYHCIVLIRVRNFLFLDFSVITFVRFPEPLQYQYCVSLVKAHISLCSVVIEPTTLALPLLKLVLCFKKRIILKKDCVSQRIP